MRSPNSKVCSLSDFFSYWKAMNTNEKVRNSVRISEKNSKNSILFFSLDDALPRPELSESKFPTAGMNSFETERRAFKYAAGDKTGCSYGRRSNRGEVRLLGCGGVGGMYARSRNSFLPPRRNF
ncbi:hypothetical protein CDAR_116801 [Caerostris darwini]|uniref:Uncharacterized protein n=1 Tax=Caerostris darwini TaxID=1538125 RepID=A0AAV4W7T2_9ARAC|nr:hypothetical protein CDAR_116801 [Caerostris darwini]